MNKIFSLLGVAFFAAWFSTPSVFAEEFYCEVLSVEGTVTMMRSSDEPKALEEGDLLQVEDAIEVGADSYVDISYDKDWSNVTRVEENSKIVIKAIYPTTIELEEGGVYAKLKALPKDSTFEVKTPTAIASVRGTEYRTTVVGGETEIYNLSDSDVYVYGVDEAGSRQATPVVLINSQKTQIAQRGHAPMAPRAMEQRDFQPVERFRQGIERKIQDNNARGRVGKIQDVKTVERFHEQQKAGGHSGALRSDGGGKGSDGKREPLKPMSGEDAHNRVKEMTGSEKAEGFDRGRSVYAGEQKQGENFEGRGLGQPYFPSDESSRSGGPEPAGFPSDRWRSGSEGRGDQDHADRNFEANRERGDAAHQQVKNEGRPQQQAQNQHQNQGQNQRQNEPNSGKKGGNQNRGGARPGPRR